MVEETLFFVASLRDISSLPIIDGCTRFHCPLWRTIPKGDDTNERPFSSNNDPRVPYIRAIWMRFYDLTEPQRMPKTTVSKTVAVAESLTGGMVGSDVVSRSGASDYFLGGIVAYTLEAKVQNLFVDRKLAEACDCVSAEVAEQMAVGVCRLFTSDVGVSTTGFAEPHGDQPQHAYVGLYDTGTGKKFVRHVEVDTGAGSPASRNDFRRRVTNTALAMLHEYASVPA